MADIQTEFLGKTLSSPFWIGSGAFQTVGSNIERWVDQLVEHHWSGIVTKSYLGTEPLNSWLTSYLWTTKTYRSMMMQNLGPPPVALEANEAKALKKSVRKCHENGVVVVGNIIGRNPAEWLELAKNIEESGCDAIEVNLGCPAPPIKGHPSLLERHEKFFEVIAAVKSVVRVPILVKINAQVLDRVKMASDCQRAGADAITAINSVGGIIGINIDTGIPICSDTNQVAVMSGISGPLIKPIGLRVVAEIALHVDIPICGAGGISHWKDVVEYFMVGASVVQICTAAMWKGFSIGTPMYQGLKKFLAEKRWGSLSQLRGISLPYFQKAPGPIRPHIGARINGSLCSRCHLCYVACHEGAHGAIEADHGTYTVNKERCSGCGLCRVVCRKEAIQMVPDAEAE